MRVWSYMCHQLFFSNNYTRQLRICTSKPYVCVKRLRGAQLLLASITLFYVVLWLSYVVQDEPMKHVPLIL